MCASIMTSARVRLAAARLSFSPFLSRTTNVLSNQWKTHYSINGKRLSMGVRSFTTNASSSAKSGATAAESAASSGPVPSMAKNKKRLSRRQIALRIFGPLTGFGALYTLYTLSLPDEGEEIDPNESNITAAYNRVHRRLQDYFVNPIDQKLLPDPLPEPYQRPYTLVIDLDKTLVYSTWSLESGWRTFSRPGAEYFLAYLSNFFEIVVYSEKNFTYAEPIINKLDKQGFVMYRLYRDSMRYEKGKNIKDISLLNRNLATVVVLDDETEPLQYNLDNLIQVKSFEGDPNDRYLLSLIPFLETLAMSGVKDVRPIINQYRGLDVPTAFAENQRRLAEMQRVEQMRQQQKGKGILSFFKSQQPPQPSNIVEQQMEQHKQFMQFIAEQNDNQTMQPPPQPEVKMSILGWLKGEEPKISPPQPPSSSPSQPSA